MGVGKIDVNKNKGDLIDPSDWNKIIMDENTRIIDVRNNFEIEIGKFYKSERPNTKSFRQFPSTFKKMNIKKNEKIAMYCTGGIRCEKASAFLKSSGYKNIVQLDGGILNYLKYTKHHSKKIWNGECFVFDNRVTLKYDLSQGKYIQCFGSRRPITKKDVRSPLYKKGVSCPPIATTKKINSAKITH